MVSGFDGEDARRAPGHRSAEGPTRESMHESGHAPSWQGASARAAQAGAYLAQVQAPVNLPLAQCVGEVTACDVLVLRPVPHYDSSAMDGYAVVGAPPWRVVDADVFGTAPAEPVFSDSASAATAPSDPPPPGAAPSDPPPPGAAPSDPPPPDSVPAYSVQSCALPVLTGAGLPPHTLSVVREEFTHITVDGSGVRWLALAPGAPAHDLDPGRNIRRAGREAQPGDTVVSRGTVLSPAHVAFAAVAGFDDVAVVPRARVGLLLTGDEVDETGQPPAGRVRDAFGPQLPGYVRALGGEVVGVRRVGDSVAEVANALAALARAGAQVIVSTGGSGHSRADTVRALAEGHVCDTQNEGHGCADQATHAGADQDTERAAESAAENRPRYNNPDVSSRASAPWEFSQLDMRPGHPTFLYANQYAGHTCVHVGLPGNPLAAMVAVEVVVRPLLRAARGLAPRASELVTVGVALQSRVTDRVTPAVAGTDGLWRPTGANEANMLRGLAHADGLIVIPRGGCKLGERVACLRLDWA